MSYLLTKFHCLIAFTSCDIGQYVYCNCFPGFEVMNFEVLLVLLNLLWGVTSFFVTNPKLNTVLSPSKIVKNVLNVLQMPNKVL